MTTDKPSPVAEPASEDCVDTSLPTMQTALRAAWEGDYTKSARYVELTATKLEARDQHNQAKWLRIALKEMQGKRQPVVVYAMSVPAPAADERTPDSGHLAAAPKQQGGEELPEPVAKIHSDGYWTAGKSFKEPLNFASMELYTADQLRTAIAAERAKSDALKTVMIAAAEEIAAHWNAHCDAEGYGPQNLMRRLEEGIPSEYGYTAGAFAELKSDADSFLWLTEDHADAETRAKCRELLGRMAVMGRGAARAAIAAERERNTAAHLACGHPAELMLRSAETGAPLYCELCDDKAGRRDAEKRESELQAELSTLRQQLAEAVRDAKRYRWLRRIDSFAEWNRVGHYAADALDAAIDAAIAAQGEANPPGVERELFEGE